MGKLERGLKAGILAMIITQLIGSIITVALMITANPYPENPSFITLIAISSLIGAIFIGAILGAILGAIYSALYTVLPSDSPIVKGMILGLAYYLIGTLLEYLIILAFTPYPESISSGMLAMIMSPLGIVTIMLDIFVFGFLIGKFWGTEPLEEETAFAEMSPGMA